LGVRRQQGPVDKTSNFVGELGLLAGEIGADRHRATVECATR
jgi:hypothetical protein